MTFALEILSYAGKSESLRLNLKHQVQDFFQTSLLPVDIGLVNVLSINCEFLLAIENRFLQKQYEFLRPRDIGSRTQFINKGIPRSRACAVCWSISVVNSRQEVLFLSTRPV